MTCVPVPYFDSVLTLSRFPRKRRRTEPNVDIAPIRNRVLPPRCWDVGEPVNPLDKRPKTSVNIIVFFAIKTTVEYKLTACRPQKAAKGQACGRSPQRPAASQSRQELRSKRWIRARRGCPPGTSRPGLPPTAE